MNIVITGGLGYIGSELCKLYSGKTRLHKITVIDTRFFANKVTQLRRWGMDFVQGSILNDVLIKDTLKDADLIYHLAGITDVAYTKTQSNALKDRLITEVGVHGTMNVITYSKQSAKIVFPSTHVVFEGLSETKLLLNENEPTRPVLTYAKGKAQSESDLANSNKRFVILRLGSVYGYSTDTMRINIMPNLFSKITAENGEIKLFANGVQHKSLVHVVDVARCMEFVGESREYNNEVFHVANENVTVKGVAISCQLANPKVTLTTTQDEIPNLGYTLSNHKLLSTGFEFHFNLSQSIAEMISKWSKPNASHAGNETIVSGADNFIDKRGTICNFELTEPINLVGLIHSKAGAIRANHYHPVQEQKCLLIQGKYISVTQDLLDPTATCKTVVVKAGELSIIPPNIAHAMIFLEDSILVNLVNGERQHENYGVTHTIPYQLVDEKAAAYLTQ